MASTSPLAPTFYGHIASTQDALVLFEGCLSGALNHVARRPHDRERVSLIKSGNVFIYEEHSSGIKRWTDGVPWSPSRILGNFLVYRELERPFPPGEKKRAMKRTKRPPGVIKQDAYGGAGGAGGSGYSPTATPSMDTANSTSLSKETERSLIGSLIDSYGFKDEGLVKKTVSVTVGGVSHHLVSYYTVADVMSNKFTTPTKDPRFQHIVPRNELSTKQNFRTPIEEVDSIDRLDDRMAYGNFSYTRAGYNMSNQGMPHRSIPQPTPPLPYALSPTAYPDYAVPHPYNQYEATPQASYGDQYKYHNTQGLGIYSAPKLEHYDANSAFRTQRYNSITGVDTESSRTQISPVTTNFSRRPSNFEQGSTIDSGMPGLNSSSNTTFTGHLGYSSPAVYYGGMREMTDPAQTCLPDRSLPTPNQQSHDRRPVQAYSSNEHGTWMVGSANIGSGHYMAPQHPRTTS